MERLRVNRRVVWSWREELNLQPAVYKKLQSPFLTLPHPHLKQQNH